MLINIGLEELSVDFYDKKVRAEIRKNPRKFIDDDSSYKGAEEYKVLTSSKNVTYVVIPRPSMLPLEQITAANHRADAKPLTQAVLDRYDRLWRVYNEHQNHNVIK